VKVDEPPGLRFGELMYARGLTTRRRQLVMGAAGITLAVLVGAGWLGAAGTAHGGHADAAPSGTGSGVAHLACPADPGQAPDAGADACHALAGDAGQRQRLTAPQSSRLSGDARRLLALLTQPSSPDTACAAIGSCGVQDGPPSDAELRLARDTLRSAGYPATSVTVVPAGGAAGAGTIIAAVRTGPGCVIATRADRQQWAAQILGTLPDGECLSKH
jgi:hypothetical protein